ncbi:P-loop NTPase [Erythrobacter sp. KY5]|uniref:P-loop NTPase n=1 Tax=Erythrobacter sp. KY5 TaxID=2011159 RepID=UPI0013A6A6EF|nr:P-loop NTPase [Erythrobacter sp. KY5]
MFWKTRKQQSKLEAEIRKVLRSILTTDGSSLADHDRLDGISISPEGAVAIAIAVRDKADAEAVRLFIDDAKERLAQLKRVKSVSIVPVRNRQQPERAEEPGQAPTIAVRRGFYYLGIASGKGGVGKSTLAVATALALRDRGLSVGLLDADLYGPSVHALLGCKEAPSEAPTGMQAITAQGIEFASMGGLLEDYEPLVWRGPIASRTVLELVNQTQWGDIDVMIVDMPPGTGDIQLSLIRDLPLSAAIVVTTPSSLGQIDARRACSMFERFETPILGQIANMSRWACPECGTVSAPFEDAGSRALDLPVLASIPLLENRSGDDQRVVDRISSALQSATDVIAEDLRLHRSRA